MTVDKSMDASSTVPDGGSDNDKSQKRFFIRWSRINKSVELNNASGGLIAGSAPTSDVDKSASNDSRLSKFLEKMRRNVIANGKKPTKKILNHISAYAAPGEVLACMGPSGSGKTSLLDVLSGRSSKTGGVISINGNPTTPRSMKRLMAKIAYVKQEDIFFTHLTVRDQLTYTALLRLPGAMSKKEKTSEVDKVINLLRLNKAADSAIMLVSGGEKKRVNIGTELLTDPLVLLLDEPTSGLDSTSAVSLLNLLRNLAQDQGKTIITTIHQPSSKVFHAFDKLLMLCEGNVVYFGKPLDSLSYLRNIQLACPDGYNAADHWMDLLVNDVSMEDVSRHAGKDQGEEYSQVKQLDDNQSSRDRLQAAWDHEAVAEQIENVLVKRETESVDDNRDEETTKRKYNTSWTAQYLVLIHRCLKNSRSSIFTPLNLIKSVCIGVISGMLWWQMDYTESTVRDRSAYFFFTMTYWVFDSMFNALMAFPTERKVILKERASASYRLSAYFMAKTTSDAPVRLILPLLYMATSFWMAGIDDRFLVFAGSVACTLLSVVAGEAIGIWVGAAVPDFEKGITILTISMLALMLLGGFFVENIPDFISWAIFLSPFKYALDSSLQLVFDRPVPCDGSGFLEEACNGRATGYASKEDILKSLNVQGSIGFNVGMLMVICIVPRYLAYVALRRQKEDVRS